MHFTVNLGGRERRFKRTARIYKKDIRLDLNRYDEEKLRELIDFYKYDPVSTASLFLEESQLNGMRRWLPRALTNVWWNEDEGFSRFFDELRSLYEDNPVIPAPFGEKALKSRLMQGFGLSKRGMRYGLYNPYDPLTRNYWRALGYNQKGVVEFVRFKGEGIHVVSINGTVLPRETIRLEKSWELDYSSVEAFARGKDGSGGIVFIYQTTGVILKGLNKSEPINIYDNTIAGLIVPPGERDREEGKRVRDEWINPQWLIEKKAQGYRDEKMQKLFSKRHERLNLLADEIVPLVNELYDEIGQLTSRQVYYQAVVRGLIFNHSKSYNNFIRFVTKLKEWGVLNYDLFEDRSRQFNRPNLWSFKFSPAEYYSKILSEIDGPELDIWEDQPYYVELWVEKEALLPLLWKIGEKFRISTFSLKGFSSRQKLYEAYKHLKQKRMEGKHCVILYMGDLGPSGIGIFRALKEKPLKQWRKDLRGFLYPSRGFPLEDGEEEEDEVERELCEKLTDVAEVERIALTKEQVEQYLKPHDLFKPDSQRVKMSDPRAKAFLEEFGKDLGDNCYELDALSPNVLMEIASEAIARYFDPSKAGDEERWMRDFKKIKGSLSMVAERLISKLETHGAEEIIDGI